MESVQFEVTVPPSFPSQKLVGKVIVSQDSIPVGHVRFTLQVARMHLPRAEPEPIGEEALRYGMAFLSYASKDREQVLARVQTLQRLGIRYFHDLLYLEPRDRWDQKLHMYIDHCDLFLLFWSGAARDSEWVRKEFNHALSRKGEDGSALPQIRPLLMEGSSGDRKST